MNPHYLSPGSLDPSQVGARWVLVFGGVTRKGNRTARRTTALSLESGLDVVWFDGFVEKYPDTNERVPLDVETPGGWLTVVEFDEAEARSLAGRLWTGKRVRAHAATRPIWRLVLRRIGSILRPRACWNAIRADVESLSRSATPPEAIVYSDDSTITSAWHAARMWRDARVSTSVLLTPQ